MLDCSVGAPPAPDLPRRVSAIRSPSRYRRGQHTCRAVCAALDDLLRDQHLIDTIEAWQVEHSVKEYSLHDGAQPARPGLAVDRPLGDGAECFLRHSEINPLHLEQPLILLHQRVLGLGQDELERGLVEILKRRYDRKAADEFRDQAVLEQVFRLDVAEDLALLSILGRR